MNDLEVRFKNRHLLSREDRIQLDRELQIIRPDFLIPYVPKWWWWRRCPVDVLIVCDGGLNFDTGAFGLSEFLTAFNELEATTWVNYRVTLAHRGVIINSTNPVVINHIGSFKFDTSVNLNDFDQVWLFAIDPGNPISASELNAIESYMDGGGGLFATGDHGWLGNGMCGSITRVKDMRYWNDFPSNNNLTNEVSMGGQRRNDTNKPQPGSAFANDFHLQSDAYPQTIAVRTFGSGMPHPLLSIPTSIRPSGIIDIMPDHPHEGECKPETVFTVNSVSIPTQIIATSFVPGGSTSGVKAPTQPHCFPSISVWDGRPANAGRIVIDSTWHHFVNVNLNGIGNPSGYTGLTTSDFEVIRRYFMNIATWMSRHQFFFCWWVYAVHDLLENSQIVEASLDNPELKLDQITLADLNSIGGLAEEELATRLNPAAARSFLCEVVKQYQPNFAELLDIWTPRTKEKDPVKSEYYQNWFNLDLILWTSVGAGFAALRNEDKFRTGEIEEENLKHLGEVFGKGVDYGYNVALDNLNKSINRFRRRVKAD